MLCYRKKRQQLSSAVSLQSKISLKLLNSAMVNISFTGVKGELKWVPTLPLFA